MVDIWWLEALCSLVLSELCILVELLSAGHNNCIYGQLTVLASILKAMVQHVHFRLLFSVNAAQSHRSPGASHAVAFQYWNNCTWWAFMVLVSHGPHFQHITFLEEQMILVPLRGMYLFHVHKWNYFYVEFFPCTIYYTFFFSYL